MWEQLKRIIKPNGAIVLFGNEPFSSFLRTSNISDYKYDWVWVKRPVNFLNAKIQPLRKTERISVFGGSRYFPQDLVAQRRIHKRSNSTQTNREHGKENVSEFTNYPTDVLEFIGERGLHPTQKPVALMEYLIRTYTNEGETILDFTAGSGTTGIAAINTNRNAILIEREPEYCEIIRRRIAEAERRKNNEFFVKKPTEPTLFDFMLEGKQ
jgi:site-specific DNA-methyltransferase (adenine-specific)